MIRLKREANISNSEQHVNTATPYLLAKRVQKLKSLDVNRRQRKVRTDYLIGLGYTNCNRTMSYLRTESKLDKLPMHAMAVLRWLEKYAIQGEAQCHNTINIILIQNDSQLEMSRQGIKYKTNSCLCIYKTGICWCYIKSIGQNSRETFRRSRLSFPQKLLLN